MDQKAAGVFASAAVIRLVVFLFFPSVSDFLSTQVELSTPVSSFKRLKEGLFLYEHGVSPYDGGLFHQAPLLLVVFGLFPSWLVFTTLDLLNGWALKKIADGLRLSSPRFQRLDGTIIAAAYLLSPFTIFSCLGQSTSVLSNSGIVQAILSAYAGNGSQAMFALAIASYLTIYPALLLPPVLLILFQDMSNTISTYQAATIQVSKFALFFAALVASTKFITGDISEFVTSSYGFQLTVPDLTPNIGLWWYFLIEIFDSFRDFFVGVFWLHLAGYTGGLSLRLPHEPLFVATNLLGLCAVFKPYPNLADVSLYLAFLPMYQHLLPLTRYTFIAASVLLYSSLLGPAFHWLWIYAGSGNANFFYAITLVWSLGLAVLIGDTLFAVLRDEYETRRPEMKDKELARI